jgi:hypothetical protein
MMQAYRDDNKDDTDFKFFHVFKRIDTCTKWILTPAKEIGFDPTASTPTTSEGPEKCIADAVTREAKKAAAAATREHKNDARWSTMMEKQDVKISLFMVNVLP